MHVSAPAVYPRIYRPSLVYGALSLAFGAIFLTGAATVLPFLLKQAHQVRTVDLVALGSFVLVLALLVFSTLNVLRSRVVLFPDRIEVRQGFMHTRVLARDQILGTRKDPNGRKFRLLLVPRDSGKRTLKIENTIKLDESFFDWLGEIPDLDEADRRQALAEIANDVNIGATPDERLAALEKGKRVARLINVVSAVLAVGAFVFSWNKLDMAILIVLPLIAVAIVARFKDIMRVAPYRNDPHPSVAVAIVFPSLALAFKTLTEMNLVHGTNAAWLTFGVAAIFWYVAIKADSTLTAQRAAAVAFAAFALIYGYGAGLQLNAVLDRSAPTTYEATISGKYTWHGRRSTTTTYHLWIEPWALRKERNTISVTRAVYEAVARGDSVFLSVRRGAFGVAWYEIQSYRGRGAQSP